jgi:acyl-CoA dehydrogenase
MADEFSSVLDALDGFLRSEVFPRHRRHADVLDEPRRRYAPDGSHSPEVRQLRREVRMASAAAGFYQMFVPEALGGQGLGWTELYRSWEFLHRRCGMRNWLGFTAIAHWVTGPSPALTEMMPGPTRDLLLPVLLSGEQTLCFAMSEPDAGTDLWNMQTRAERVGDRWRLTGTKQWITNGAEADWALVFAVTDIEAARARTGGLTAFVVPTSAPGLSVDSVIRLFGHAGGHEAILHLEAVEVPDHAVVGQVGDGLRIGLLGVNIGRMFNSAKSVGLARWALELTLHHAGARKTFGKRLIDHQALAFRLADAAIDVRAAHLLGLDCAARLDQGQTCRKEAAMAKAYSTEMACRVIDEAMQIHGGIGLTNELGLADAWHEVRIVRIADGSAEMLRRTIAHRLARGDVEL